MSSSATPPNDRPPNGKPPTPPGGAGTHAVGEEDRRRRPLGWLWILAAVIVAVVVLLLILRSCNGTSKNPSNPATTAVGSVTPTVTDTDTNTAQTTNGAGSGGPTTASATTTAATTAPTTPVVPPAGGAGTLKAGGKDVLPLSAVNGSTGSLAAFAGKSATATSVVVQSVPVDNGFWIGPSATNRVWVQLLQPGLVSPHPVRVGDHVTFTGTMIANPAGFAQTAGLTAETGAAQLTAQGAHVQAAKTSIVFR